ncbi:MAG: 16S rRNA (cytidine(1402)-2'-O)-methyltransferase [Bacilli bacterium]|nr:16S rRNA (cytidine(1402)-2'-O)-methyltransferase [Bacilli bacterium]
MIQKSYEKSKYGNLYIVPTPIGNLDDITIRALNTLKEVDYILSEDTRVTLVLLNKYEIKKKLCTCHKFNEAKIKDKVLNDLKNGLNIALVTDRGTPLISDPGSVIVKSCIDNEINVIALPGPSALLPALNVSGLDTEKFLFYGFLSNKETERKKELEMLKEVKFTIVLYESPHRLPKTLQNMRKILGNRQIIISREITKRYEEVFRGTIEEAIEVYKNILGEIVIVVEKNNEKDIINEENLIKEVDNLVKSGLRKKEAIKIVAEKFNFSKNLLYNMYEMHERKN